MSNQIEVLTATHGIAPRSDELLRLGADFERGRVSREDFDRKRRIESIDWLQFQHLLGIDYPENGKLLWQDHLRPIVKACTGFIPDVDAAPVTRWFESNRFYRQPTIIGPIELQPELLNQTIDDNKPQISLLAPWSFYQLCKDETPDASGREAVIGLYDQLFSYFTDRHISDVVLEEYGPKDYLLDRVHLRFTDKLIQLTKEYPELSSHYLAIHGSSHVLPNDLPTNVAWEVRPQTITHLSRIFKRTNLLPAVIWQKVVNTTNTKTDALNTELWPKAFLQQSNVSKIILTHNTDLEYLPQPYAITKVRTLKKLADQLTEHLRGDV